MIQHADPVARMRALVLLVAVAAAGVVCYFVLEQWLLQVRTRPRPEVVQALAGALHWGSLVTAATVGAFGVYAWAMGRRIRIAARFPPPGWKTIRDTIVLEGPQARSRGRVIQSLAIGLILLAVAQYPLVYFLAAALVGRAT